MEALLFLGVIAVVALAGAAAGSFGVDSREEATNLNNNLGVR